MKMKDVLKAFAAMKRKVDNLFEFGFRECGYKGSYDDDQAIQDFIDEKDIEIEVDKDVHCGVIVNKMRKSSVANKYGLHSFARQSLRRCRVFVFIVSRFLILYQ